MGFFPTFQTDRRTFFRSGLHSCAAVAAAMGAVPLLRAESAGKPVVESHVSIGVPQAASLSNLPLLLARELGFFRAEGIVLDWKRHVVTGLPVTLMSLAVVWLLA